MLREFVATRSALQGILKKKSTKYEKEIWEGQRGLGSWGEIAWGEIPDIGDGEEGSKSHCHVCTYTTILHVLHMYPKT